MSIPRPATAKKEYIVENHLIMKAAADRETTASMFLPYAAKALSSPEDSIKKHASEALIIKARQCTFQDFQSLQEAINRLDVDQTVNQYLLHLSSIGFYFTDCKTEKEEKEVLDAVLWLINNDPSNGCLEMPYCTDIAMEWFDVAGNAWNQVVDENPNDVRIINNAAQFFFVNNATRARELLQRCAVLEPSNSLWRSSLEELNEFFDLRNK